MDQKQTRKVEKLDYIDGLKVCACMMIFNFHFINAFYAGFYSLRPEEYHLPALEYFVGSSPLNLIMGGKFGVRMFMTISGFFVGYRFFLTGEGEAAAVLLPTLFLGEGEVEEGEGEDDDADVDAVDGEEAALSFFC